MKKVMTVREWKQRKIIKEAIGVIIALVGAIIFISSFFTGGPTMQPWRFPLGFFIAIAGVLFWLEANDDTYRKYTKKVCRK